MAFRHLFNCSNNDKVCHFQLARSIRGRSTRQISLGKIVNTICSVSPPPHDLNHEKNKSDCALYGFDLNLPLGIGSSPPPPPLEDDFGAVEKSSVVERDLTEHEKSPREDSVGTEITGGEIEETDNQRLMIQKGEGCLELLIEAAKLISGGFEDDDVVERAAQNGSKAVWKGKRWKRVKESENRTAAELRRDLDGNEPVRRSRSGRCNVLPSKYRDSVVEL